MTPSRSPLFAAKTWLFAGALAAGALSSAPAAASPSFTTFESGQVRPLALSPSGKLLFAVNTPDNRLEIFRVQSGGIVHQASIPVGLEPVAVAARSEGEVWVVNHLSDSVSVVQLDGGSGHVARTLFVGDEPRDIVFAGPGRKRAFITTAHRGQNSPIDPQLTTAGVGRADVWVFNAESLGASAGGDPLTIVSLFSDTPRALAVSPDGSRVYAAAFKSGNRTTAITETVVSLNGGLPGPSANVEGVPAPRTGLIVKYRDGHWRDEDNRVWDAEVELSLPDKDVFTLDATANPPQQVAGAGGFFTGVGTVLYNMAVNPASGKVYVSNTDARNDQRFEGPGILAGHSVRGHVVENRITVLTPGSGAVTARHLNKHVDYSVAGVPVPNAESQKSLALPTGMVVSQSGATLYVAAMGSSKVGVLSTAALESDTFTLGASNEIALSGGGPTGLALDEARGRLYVLTRFDDSISVIDTSARAEIGHVALHNPEPLSVRAGRRFLYDAAFTSSHGDQACASCHVFGDMDDLAWDLGNPDAAVLANDNPFSFLIPANPLTGEPVTTRFHPMKGPMTTQSLRGLRNGGPMHWRGDRTGGLDAQTAQPDSGAYDEQAAFEKFNVAFDGLLGRSGPIPDADMQAFTDFVLQMTFPPNPIRALDNSLTPDQAAGEAMFKGDRNFDGPNTCHGCHTTDPNGNPGTAAPGFFGTSGNSTFDFEPQTFKVPQLRNMYQKVGMFGEPAAPIFLPDPTLGVHQGDQVRGFGFFHDGSVDTMFRFHDIVFFAQNPAFNPNGFPVSDEGVTMKRQLESYLLAFESNLAPIVGQQVTLGDNNLAAAAARVDLLEARSSLGECDLIAKAQLFGGESGFVHVGGGNYLPDRQGIPPIPGAVLRLIASVVRVTYTCVPPGSGVRLGIDRDGDGFLDGDEMDHGRDPADPDSTP
jgi:DNA-binding beta-propeller fold protein YncE